MKMRQMQKPEHAAGCRENLNVKGKWKNKFLAYRHPRLLCYRQKNAIPAP